MATTHDWAQALIAELRECGIEDSAEATRRFVAAYQAGDSPEAWQRYAQGATVKTDGAAKAVLFGDGSVYCDGLEGIDRFFPSLAKFRSEAPDEAARFEL